MLLIDRLPGVLILELLRAEIVEPEVGGDILECVAAVEPVLVSLAARRGLDRRRMVWRMQPPSGSVWGRH